jgi:hypothetical protein
MQEGSITVSAIDKRNVTHSKSIPFIRYKAPTIDIIDVENGIMLDNTIIILPPNTKITLRATSVVGLSKIIYRIGNNQEQVITLNGNKEYTFSITIPYE